MQQIAGQIQKLQTLQVAQRGWQLANQFVLLHSQREHVAT
jgi:hypothetical protein